MRLHMSLTSSTLVVASLTTAFASTPASPLTHRSMASNDAPSTSITIPANDVASDLVLSSPATGLTLAEGGSTSGIFSFANVGMSPLLLAIPPPLIQSTGYTAKGLWHRTNRRSSTGNWSWGFCREQDGAYDGERTKGDLIVAGIRFANNKSVLSFDTWLQTEPNTEFVHSPTPKTELSYSYDGQNWHIWNFNRKL